MRPFAVSRRVTISGLLALALLTLASPAQAQLILNIQSVSGGAGTTGNVLDVTILNTGAAVTIAGFGFEVAAASPSVQFTGATTGTTTAAYIFNGHSLFGPNIDTSVGQTLDASDNYDTVNSGVVLGTNATLGLGHLVFNIAPGATGTIQVSFTTAAANSLSGPAGNPIPITTFNSGLITVTTSSVPEPSVAALSGVLILGAVGRFGWARRKRRRA